MLLNRPELFDLAAERIDPHDFQDPDLRAVAECAWEMGHAQRLALEDLLAAEAMSRYGGLLTDLAAEGERRGNWQETLHGAISHLLYVRQSLQGPPAGQAGQYTDEALRQVSQRSQAADVRRHPKIT